jgi:hypothetical protein
VLDPQQRGFIPVDGKKVFTAFTEILAGAALFAFLNCFSAFTVGTFMVPFFFAY